jgi:hypothetical protein
VKNSAPQTSVYYYVTLDGLNDKVLREFKSYFLGVSPIAAALTVNWQWHSQVEDENRYVRYGRITVTESDRMFLNLKHGLNDPDFTKKCAGLLYERVWL